MKFKLTTVFTLVTALMLTPAPVTSAGVEPTPTCDIGHEVSVRLSELGETGRSTWIIDPAPDPELLGEVTAPDVVHLNPRIPCGMIHDVVNHEWMHLLQERAYPGRADRAYGGHEQLELVADCGSKLLGSSYTPYETIVHPCGADEYESAMWLIKQSGMAGVLTR